MLNGAVWRVVIGPEAWASSSRFKTPAKTSHRASGPNYIVFIAKTSMIIFPLSHPFQALDRTMPASMRKQTRQHARRAKYGARAVDAQLKAVELLEDGLSIRKTSETTGLRKSFVGNLRQQLKKNGKASTLSAVNEARRGRGRGTVLTREEEKMIVDRLVFAAQRGFAVGVAGLKYVMSQIAADGRPGWKRGVPSDDAIRSFRARNRDIALRTTENKASVKLKGEQYHHVEGYFRELHRINNRFPGILNDGDRVWNMDESAAETEFGKKTKSFASSRTHHGGSCSAKSSVGPGKHVTALIVASASGHKAPPFFFVAGCQVMKHWIDPIPLSFEENLSRPDCKVLLDEDWFPRDGVIRCSENGSTEQANIHLFIQHFNNYARKFVPQSTTILLSLDGHSSRGGYEWLEMCKEYNIEVIQAPANTSHFLQPCDQTINKTFKESVRRIRDDLCGDLLLDTRAVKFKLMCSVLAHSSITVADIRRSFEVTGLYPINNEFAKRFLTPEDKHAEKAVVLKRRLEAIGPAGCITSVKKRRADSETYEEVVSVINEGKDKSRALQKIHDIMEASRTTHTILKEVQQPKVCTTVTGAGNAGSKRVSLDAGAPASCLTIGDVIEHRRKLVQLKEVRHREKELTRVRREKLRAEKLQSNAEKKRLVQLKKQRRTAHERAEVRSKLLVMDWFGASNTGRGSYGGRKAASVKVVRGIVAEMLEDVVAGGGGGCP